jgi:uncharacterized membrane protein YbhN (UPF0104 family)
VICGTLLLFHQASQGPGLGLLAAALAGGVVMVGGLLLVQYWGVTGLLRRLAGRFLKNRRMARLLGGLEDLEAETARLYADRRRLAVATLIRLSGWVLKSGETYLALYFMGAGPSVGQALVLESMAIAANSFGFFMPGALGIREGGIMIIAGMLGLPADTALALALVKRVRELLVGLPGLAALLITQRDLLIKPGRLHAKAALPE